MTGLFQRIWAEWARLSPRERVLLAATGAMLLIALLSLGVVNPLLDTVSGSGLSAPEFCLISFPLEASCLRQCLMRALTC